MHAYRYCHEFGNHAILSSGRKYKYKYQSILFSWGMVYEIVCLHGRNLYTGEDKSPSLLAEPTIAARICLHERHLTLSNYTPLRHSVTDPH